MKAASLYALLGALGSAAALAACSSDSPSHTAEPQVDGGHDETGGGGGGGSSSGGKGGSGSSTGGKGGSGGSTGGKGGALDAGDQDTGTPSDGGAGGTGGVDSGSPDDAGSGGAATDAGCEFPRCGKAYPVVGYPAENPDSDPKALLGKVLFWDEQMGQRDDMACGTCHRGAAGGSDPRTNSHRAAGMDGVLQTQPDPLSDDLRVAAGVPQCDISGAIVDATVQTTGRKPPSYFDAMFAGQIFWDGRAGYCKSGESAVGGCFYDPDNTSTLLIQGTANPDLGVTGGALEQQASGPPASSVEMACTGRNWAAIEAKFSQTSLVPLGKAKSGTIPTALTTFIGGRNYPQIFSAVYGNDPKYKVNPGSDPDDIINARRIVYAIATHERRLKTDQTPWDLWNDGTPAHDAALTASQIAGFQLFMTKAKCNFCHPPPLFTDNAFHNVGFHKPTWGLSAVAGVDIGRQSITGAANNADLLKYKTPTLRNVGLREQFGLLHEGDGPGHDLKTVMDLYNSGGKRSDTEIVGGIDPSITALGLTQSEISQIIDFLRNGLTDPRVQSEQFPFDRPKLSTE